MHFDRGSCVKTDKLPHVMSLGCGTDWVQSPTPQLCLGPAAQGYIGPPEPLGLGPGADQRQPTCIVQQRPTDSTAQGCCVLLKLQKSKGTRYPAPPAQPKSYFI